MTIYNLYIFDRNGTMLYYQEWNRKKQTGIPMAEESKLMYGMIYSLKSFVSKVSPIDTKEGYLSYETSKYVLHFYETPSRLKLIMNTDPSTQAVRELLHQIFTQVYVDYAVLNPLWAGGKKIESELFASKLDELVKANPAFT